MTAREQAFDAANAAFLNNGAPSANMQRIVESVNDVWEPIVRRIVDLWFDPDADGRVIDKAMLAAKEALDG